MESLRKKKNDRRTEEEKKQEQKKLLDEYYDTLLQLRQVRSAFEQVTDPELISACVYEMNAMQQRYSYLLQRIKAERLTSLRVLR